MSFKIGRTIFRTKFGSNLYGTHTKDSDLDFKSVVIPSSHDIIHQTAKGCVQKNTKENQNTKNSSEDIDDELISIYKFCDMLAVGDMIATELLFVPVKFRETYDHNGNLIDYADWDKFINRMKHMLISRNVNGFIGYSRKQAAKYGIKGSRVATVRNVLVYLKEMNSNDKVGVYADTFEELSKHQHCSLEEIKQANGQLLKHFVVCQRKIPYTIKISEATKIVQRLFDEYGSRSLMAEKSEGVDFKAISHAVRVSEQAIELLTTESISFPRHNADELIDIKLGKIAYPIIAERLENNLDKLENLVFESNLRSDVNTDYLRAIITHFHVKEIKNEYGF